MVQDRSTVHHLGKAGTSTSRSPLPSRHVVALERNDIRPDLLHCDLLHHARQRWKKKLPNCRLQTLEQYVCGRRRSGDIAGRNIPRAYHDFVRTGDPWQIQSVLHHNALDLITLLQLSLCMVHSTG